MINELNKLVILAITVFLLVTFTASGCKLSDRAELEERIEELERQLVEQALKEEIDKQKAEGSVEETPEKVPTDEDAEKEVEMTKEEYIEEEVKEESKVKIIEIPEEQPEEELVEDDFYEDIIIFVVEDNMFPEDWYTDEINPITQDLPVAEIDRTKTIVKTALDKYPKEVLESNLRRIYVLGYLGFFGVEYGGTNDYLDTLWIANMGESMGFTDHFIEEVIHHEFSSIFLIGKYNHLFHEVEWKSINPEEFIYFDEIGYEAIQEERSSKNFDPYLHKMGFLYEYAQSTLENDFNSFAENIFMDNDSFWQAIETYPKLKQKFDLIVDFYHMINPEFTEEYFKEVSRLYSK